MHSDKKRIATLECLLQGTDNKSIKATAIICELDADAQYSDWKVGYELAMADRREKWGCTQGNVKV